MSLEDATSPVMMLFRIQTALTATIQKQILGCQKANCHSSSLIMDQYRWFVFLTNYCQTLARFNNDDESKTILNVKGSTIRLKDLWTFDKLLVIH